MPCPPTVGWCRVAAWLLGLACASAQAAGPAPEAAKPLGSADRGQVLYEARCLGCHSVDTNRVGPKHWQLLGRRAGTVADFDYSPALRESQLVWTAQTLDAWLRAPEALIPGQRMNFQVSEAQDRLDLIAYLATLR